MFEKEKAFYNRLLSGKFAFMAAGDCWLIAHPWGLIEVADPDGTVDHGDYIMWAGIRFYFGRNPKWKPGNGYVWWKKEFAIYYWRLKWDFHASKWAEYREPWEKIYA